MGRVLDGISVFINGVLEAERRQQEQIRHKEEMVWEWSTEAEKEKLVAAYKAVGEATHYLERGQRQRQAMEVVDAMYPKALSRANEASRRSQEELRIFTWPILTAAPQQSVEVLFSSHPGLRRISEFEPLGWIPAPNSNLRLASRAKEEIRSILVGASQRLRRVVNREVDFTPFVVPYLDWHRDQLYLCGRQEVVVTIELELLQGQEDIQGYKRHRPGLIGYKSFLVRPHTRIPEIHIDLEDTGTLPLPLRKFLDNADWPNVAYSVDLIEWSTWFKITQSMSKTADKNDLPGIVKRLSSWGYPSKLVEEHYNRLQFPTDATAEEKAARIAEAIDRERVSKEHEIKLPQPTNVEQSLDDLWAKTLDGARVIGLFGPMGGGKTATGHFLFELLRDKGTSYLVLYPGMPRPPVPPWIRFKDSLEEVPPGSIIILDEAALTYHARESATQVSKLMTKWVGLVRQRHQVLIIISRLSSEIDKILIAHCDIVALKRPLDGQGAFERPTLRGEVQQAEAEFKKVKGDARGWTWVWNRKNGVKKMLQNPLPSYWTEDLSEAFADVPL